MYFSRNEFIIKLWLYLVSYYYDKRYNLSYDQAGMIFLKFVLYKSNEYSTWSRQHLKLKQSLVILRVWYNLLRLPLIFILFENQSVINNASWWWLKATSKGESDWLHHMTITASIWDHILPHVKIGRVRVRVVDHPGLCWNLLMIYGLTS